ncbi:MAG: S-methyl-5'-thioadenosine phosphorylase [Armatimonadota bacterium]|nr:S-methyl-5'-thioadenosine phosphorylase [Armatimonadota bacterium]
MAEARAEIGVYGGSGFYSFLDDVEEIKVETPYGAPSDLIALATVAGKRVAFLPRHGRRHQYPPHMIPYRANTYAMRKLGVSRIIAPSACGSLQPHIKPGDFVVCDQFVDRTSGRKDTFYDGPITTHIMGANPYCSHLRELAIDVIKSQNITCHEKGTVVVIQGPRFSTKAESSWYTKMGWEVINMTQYPEVVLARELEMCYVNISLVTDWDAGCVGMPGVEPVTAEEIIKVLEANNERVRQVILKMIERMPTGPCDECGRALEHARLD